MDSSDRIARLQGLPPLAHLPVSALAGLARVVVPRTYRAGTVIFDHGAPGLEMFLLVAGTVRIERDVEAGGTMRLASLAPGEVFGEMALIGQAPRSARAVAEADVELFALDRPGLEAWVRADALPAVILFVELVRVVSQRLRRVSDELVVLHDLSHLVLGRFEDEAALLDAALARLIGHLGEQWSGAAYVRDRFTDAVLRVALEGTAPGTLPESVPEGDQAAVGPRWLDTGGLCVPLPGAAGWPLGFLVLRTTGTLSDFERSQLTVSLTATAQLLASAVQNLRHDVEERLRSRLEQQRGL
jgi:CRP/FNR family cyclic AMP-dependent transcriptional regulator